MKEHIKKLILEYKPLAIRNPASKHVRKLEEAQRIIALVKLDVQSSEDTEEKD